MRNANEGPFTVKAVSHFGEGAPRYVATVTGGRTARQIARDVAIKGERNAAFALVLAADGRAIFEARNIEGRAVPVALGGGAK